jgi:hypothetical protein
MQFDVGNLGIAYKGALLGSVGLSRIDMVAVFSEQLMDQLRGEGLRNEFRFVWNITRARSGRARRDDDTDMWPTFRDDTGEVKAIKRAGI